MGIPLDVFSLLRLRGRGGCIHWLLVRVRRPGFSNASQSEEDAAADIADRARDRLSRHFLDDVLPSSCSDYHEVELRGELQACPPGERLYEDAAVAQLGLWVAETSCGAPWVVLGEADSESRFWREVEADDELRALHPQRPARRLQAYFLPESVPR